MYSCTIGCTRTVVPGIVQCSYRDLSTHNETIIINHVDNSVFIAGWILRTFTTRDPQVMLTLSKSLVMSRLEYTSQLWSPYLLKHVYLIEKVQRAFTKHISGMCFLSYSKRLEVLKLYSLQRRRERYGIIYVWKIIEGLVPNLSDPYHLLFL